jgi:hypothetical protein
MKIEWTPDIVEYLRENRNVSSAEMVRRLAERFGLKVTDRLLFATRSRYGIKRSIPLRCVFSEDEVGFIKANKDNLNNRAMTEALNSKFCAAHTMVQVMNFRKRNGFVYRLFSDEAMEYMRSHSADSYKDICENLNRIFGKEYTARHVKSAMHYYKLKEFKKRPKKGSEEFSERLKHSKNCNVEIKVNGRWIPKSRYVYEQATGKKVEKGKVCVFLDGDIYNFDLDNMIFVDRRLLGVVNRHLGGTSKNAPDLTKCKYDIARLKCLISEKEKMLGKKRGGENGQGR